MKTPFNLSLRSGPIGGLQLWFTWHLYFLLIFFKYNYCLSFLDQTHMQKGASEEVKGGARHPRPRGPTSAKKTPPRLQAVMTPSVYTGVLVPCNICKSAIRTSILTFLSSSPLVYYNTILLLRDPDPVCVHKMLTHKTLFFFVFKKPSGMRKNWVMALNFPDIFIAIFKTF